jgi:hypothetical protein
LGLLDHARFKPKKSILSVFPGLDRKEDTLYDPKPTNDFEIKLQKRTKLRLKPAQDPYPLRDGRRYQDSQTPSADDDWSPQASSSNVGGSETVSTSGSDLKLTELTSKYHNKGFSAFKKVSSTLKRPPKHFRRSRSKRSDRGVSYVQRLTSLDHIEEAKPNPQSIQSLSTNA